MKEKEIIIKYQEFDKDDVLSESDQKLINEANAAIKTSYAPYSEFNVGAAVLLDNGEVVRGSNQENSAYPSGLCAERVALFHAKSTYPDAEVQTIAITSSAENFENADPVTPCGSCRQVMAETEKRQSSNIRVIMTGDNHITKIVDGIDNLLPMKFQEERLKKINR